MRRIILAVSAALFLGSFSASAQSNDDARTVVRQIAESLASGDTDALMRFSAMQIELTVGNQTSLYTKAQAKYVMSAFLDQHPLRNARVREVHVVGRQSTARALLIGTDRSDVWDLFIRLRRVRQGWELKELRLTPARTKSSRRSRG